jgi:nicotinate-nucleotide adenylyltransferase
MNKTRVGLFFGSFNPIHTGHMAIANYMLEFTDLTKIWFIISPHNPLKEKKSLLADHHRLELVHRALDDEFDMRAIDIEFRMPQPSYTIDTLTRLTEKYPDNEFVVIIGGDNLESLKKWKNWESILEYYRLYVYSRPGFDKDAMVHPNIHYFDAPLMEISSSFIRQAISEGKNLRHFLPTGVWNYIDEMHFYRK